MASKTTLNAKSLEALGVEKLAELLIEISTGNANHKRRLRMELAGNSSGEELAREVRKRLSSIARAKSWIDWQKVKTVKSDLETQRKTIVEKIAPTNPDEAFELIWQFLLLGDSIYERTHDGSGLLTESFHQAIDDAGRIAGQVKISTESLVGRIYAALQNNNGYSQFDRLIPSMVPALGEEGLRQLQQLFEGGTKTRDTKRTNESRQLTGLSSNEPVYRDDVYASSAFFTAKVSLQQIADALGDVDLYIAQHAEHTHIVPTVATEIGRRLVSAGRAEEALRILDKALIGERYQVPYDWQATRADALEMLGRGEEAQQFRWQCFEQSLDDEMLKEFVRRLPDFDDVEAEEKAFAYAQTHPDVQQALILFLNYPSPAEAAKLVMHRAAGLDGDRYELLSPAAEVLSAKYPLAATLLLRAMIDFTLNYARSSRYKHAARHLMECASLAHQIEEFAEFKTHDDYVADLKKVHGRKHGFWSLMR
ncbi:hypothetical protein I6H96_09290 [Brucella anthropi]|uniref:Uncharacterized protein n=1 Tax=Brucella anthropi (strain ATCC 49188 / DSM 6882 / CCUG 24695 / JCM 21032 / LMG 3331 / NBRC 15819 / NCTC 12168 / Alc 37) TaxID=439375 RepID=A6WWL8_BRUA4|nr:DUF6880 family protein [Brucella anthropi]ABS13372.1 conserved hypothetical protein [Brucella anthropi ATCC 49188]QQC24407.1 hypothetical protein I6H96_09290 [Brucella anthropi]SUA61170.1 Uncharacterised protein [Brucella anthropi]